MRALLRLFSFRFLASHSVRALLGMASISLGVALFVAGFLAYETLVRSFERSMNDLAGKAELQVTRQGGIGVDAGTMDRLRGLPGVIAAPVIQRTVNLPDLRDPSLLVLGIDFVRDSPLRMYSIEAGSQDPREFVAAAFVPNAIIVTKTFAARNGLKKGDTLKADTARGRATLLVAGLMNDEGPAKALDGGVAIMSIAAAQTLFGMPQRFDRIEAAPDGISTEELEKRLKAALGADYDVRRLARKSTAVEVALARIRAMSVISAIALVVGLFIIYNSVSISVVERVRDIGVLRSIGAGRAQILGAILLEWSALGVLGSAAGVLGGWALARALVPISAKSANQLVFAVTVTAVEFPPLVAALALAAGTLTAFAAALFPALDATRIAPVELLRQGTWQYRASPKYFRSFVFGATFLAADCLALATTAARINPFGILAIMTSSFLAFALIGPQCTLWIARALRPALRRLLRLEGYLAADNLAKFPQRTALTIVAFAGAISVMVASGTLVHSMKTASEQWMHEAFPFDFAINSSDLSASLYSQAAFPEPLLVKARDVEGVDSAYGVRATFLPWKRSEIMSIAVDFDGYLAMHRASGRNSQILAFDTPENRAALASGRGLLISDNLARLYGLSPGDSVDLPTPAGPRPFAVRGIVTDYSWPAGSVMLDRAAYARLWTDTSLTYIDVRVKPGVPHEDVRRRLATALKDETAAYIYSVPQLQQIGREAMDQALALANVQVLVALVIGFLGIVNTLLISVLRRTREIGLLRAVGASRAQIRRTIVVESVLIAVSGSAIGIAAGLTGAAWPIRLFLARIAGIYPPFVIPWDTLALAVIGGAALGVVASVAPARRAANLNVLEAIGYE
jgi:putative ABC transport system permease protein